VLVSKEIAIFENKNILMIIISIACGSMTKSFIIISYAT